MKNQICEKNVSEKFDRLNFFVKLEKLRVKYKLKKDGKIKMHVFLAK